MAPGETATVKLEGALTMRTAAAIFARPLPAGDWTFDCGGLGEIDSSALALLLAWLRRAKARGTKVELRALPEALLALARLYGVDTLLPIQE
ncbi:MAG: STAS domain-containing protein [Azoarcus sp.]|jgi:phospholipid transport system transporter-binding protein|nr:STAS domain-containing protein [Azoarcus sp.]